MKKLLTTTCIGLLSLCIHAQKNAITEKYIDKYKDIAIREMVKYGIPASITLAQAVHESASGQSELATKLNNHFGIKCAGWDGKTGLHDDDSHNECFRAYENANSSFLDHSIFLITREHYKFLFNLDIKDYKGWAKGLKKAGYATNPLYSQKIIKIIEAYKLHQYDTYDVDVPVKKDSLQYVFLPNVLL